MEAIAVMTVLVLLQYFLFGFQVGQLRGRHGVRAPATSGHPEFERMFRIQQNSLEQLVIFIPALWMFGYFADPLWGAGLGLIYVVGRYLYKRGYLADPSKRGPGFAISATVTMILLLGALWRAGRLAYLHYLA